MLVDDKTATFHSLIYYYQSERGYTKADAVLKAKEVVNEFERQNLFDRKEDKPCQT